MLFGFFPDSLRGVEGNLVFLLIHIHLDGRAILELAAEQFQRQRTLDGRTAEAGGSADDVPERCVRTPGLLDGHAVAELAETLSAPSLVVADTAGRGPLLEDVTADFVYVRLHGDVELYRSGYSDPAIARWAERVRSWSRQRDVYVYFDNDAKVHAPFDAIALMRALGLIESET